MKLWAPKELFLFNKIVHDNYPGWWFKKFGRMIPNSYELNDMLRYYREYEPDMERYYKLALSDPKLCEQESINRYYPGYHHGWTSVFLCFNQSFLL